MFNFLKNNLKKPIDIDITTSSKYYSENIEDAICQTKFPNWTKDIHVPSIREVFDHMFAYSVGYNTIKTCPAFVDILKKKSDSFLMLHFFPRPFGYCIFCTHPWLPYKFFLY